MEHEQMNRDESMSAMSDSTMRGVQPARRTQGRRNLPSDLERIFQEHLERGEFDEVEEFRLNQKIYFQDPEQLVELFTRLEEGNLSLIQMMQDTEQNLENLKNSLKLKKVEFDKKIGGLRDNKNMLDKTKNEKEEKIRNLELRAREPKFANNQDGLEPLRKKILDVADKCKDDAKGNIDLKTLPTLDLLASIELYLQKQLDKLNDYKPSVVVDLKRKSEDVRKKANRKLQLEREQTQAEEKSKKASERVLEKTRKRMGRMDMKKSTPLEKKAEVVEEVHNYEEEEDIKYFNPYLTKF